MSGGKAGQGKTRGSQRELKALHLSAEWFHLWSEAGIDGLALHENGVILDANKALAVMLGCEVPELLGRSVLDFTAPECRDEVRDKITAGTAPSYETVALRKDDTRLPVEVHAKAVACEGRRLHLSMIRDLSERKRAEAALRESETRSRQVFEDHPHPMWIYDLETLRFLAVNDAALRHYGYSREEFLAMTVSDLCLPEERPRLLERVTHVTSASVGPAGIWRHRKKDGTLVDTEITTHGLTFAGRRAEFVAALDVTERLRAERALREGEARHRHVAEHISDVIWTMDLELRFTHVSASVTALTGHRPEELLGQPLEQMLTPESAQFVRELKARELTSDRLARKEPSWSMLLELEKVRTDGARVWAEVRIGLLHDEAGKLTGLVGVTHNITERHRGRVELEKSLSLLTATLEATADGILVVDAQGRMVSFNQRFIDLWGLPREIAASGDEQAMLAFVAGQFEEPAAFLHRVRLISSRPEVESFDLLEFKDGRVFERFSKPQRIGGRIVGRVWSYRDATSRQRAEAALRLEGAALESAANAIVITNRDGEIVWCNPAFTQLTGYTAEEARGKNPRLLKSDQHTPSLYQDLWKTIASGRVWRGEMVNRRKDGSLYHEEMTITPVRNRAGEVTHFIGIKQDITARKQMEAELRQSRERFLAVFQSSPTPIAITTQADGRYLDVNEAFLRMMGYARDEVIGRTVAELRVWEQSGQRTHLLEAIAEKGFVENFEARFRDRAGVCHDCLASVKVVHLGNEPYLIFISHDITERKLLEAQLRQAQKMESIGTLAGGVAHDFNNILTLIHGHTSLVMDHAQLPEDCRDSMQQLAKAAEQASHLTRQLLTFSRKQPMQPRRADLNEIVGNLTKMLRRIIGEDIALELKYSPHRLPVFADVGMMEQLLLNLAVNARDAMPDGGLLVITTDLVQPDPTRHPQPALPEAVDYARLSVRDTGCGIEPENLPRIFDPFFTTKEVGKGTGLGLATVHGIVQQHHGFIEVDSQVRTGTVFHIFLPLQPAQVSGEADTPAPVAVRGGSETVLLVEDEQQVRLLTRQILQHYGYRVLEADSGCTALPLWEQHRAQIHLLLTDMVMPGGISGRQLADRLLTDKPELRILFTSGYSQDMIEQEASEHKGVAFLQKPYPPQTLARAVRDCLDNPQG